MSRYPIGKARQSRVHLGNRRSSAVSWWLWGLLGLLALAGESVSMALFLLNVGIAAFVAALLSYLGCSRPFR